VSDESQLQVTAKSGDSSLTLSKPRSGLIARGRRVAAILATSCPAIEADKPPLRAPICIVCGERKEPSSDSDEDHDPYCRWCRSREQEISRIWNKWGFSEFGQPLNGVWDEAAQRRDAQAKLEIDRRLEELGVGVPWIDMRWGFRAEHPHYAPHRGMSQACGVTDAINRKWGLDSDGRNPVGKAWDDEAKRRAELALQELKNTLANIGLPLIDWPDHWSPDDSWALDPCEINEGICPPLPGHHVIWCERTCNKCGEHKELVLAGRVCASCADALDRQWSGSTATDWVLTALRFSDRIHERVDDFVYVSTTYDQMKIAWASHDGVHHFWRIWPSSEDEIAAMKLRWGVWANPSKSHCDARWIRPATSDEVRAYEQNHREWSITWEADGIIGEICKKLEIQMDQEERPVGDPQRIEQAVAEISARLSQLGWLEELAAIKRELEDCDPIDTIEHHRLLEMVLQRQSMLRSL
jgi:hypothetical protein